MNNFEFLLQNMHIGARLWQLNRFDLKIQLKQSVKSSN
jgi:hypothetical protein